MSWFRRRVPESPVLVRTWYRCIESGRVFRNCGLIAMDRAKPENARFFVLLTEEWDRTFWRGVMEPGDKYNPAVPSPHDVFVPYDDSQEATDRWVERFLASHGKEY